MSAAGTKSGPALIRILIAGGGPAGLVLAHALRESGLTSTQLEVVVLERRPAIVEPSGNCLALHPPTLRVLDQLGGGMTAAVSRHGTQLANGILCDRSGAVLHTTDAYAQA